jgi:hypothetical protein
MMEPIDEQKRTRVTCTECGNDYYVTDDSVLQKRPVDGETWIDEYTLVCPHCGYGVHVMLDCAMLRRYRATIQKRLHEYKRRTPGAARAYRKAVRRFKAKSNQFHAEWRPKLGLVSPGALLAPEAIGGPDAADEEE